MVCRCVLVLVTWWYGGVEAIKWFVSVEAYVYYVSAGRAFPS